MAEESLIPVEPKCSTHSGQPIAPAALAEEARSTSNIAVDRRARLALELAAFAVERSVEGAHSTLTLGRQLRAVAEACTEATILAHGLIGRSPPSAA